jgi:hypothetical protein
MLNHGQNRRKHTKRPLRQAAWLDLGGNRSLIPPCSGARRTAARPESLPERFTLLLEQAAVKRICHVV